MIRGVAAAASDPTAADAARAALAAGGSAADAIFAGFLAAAGARAGVLLSPAVALAAGVGVGARAFDGRAAQPGRGAPRPRGLVEGEPVPDGARVAVPRSLGMLVLLHGYLGRARLRDLARPGVLAAERAGARSRAALLRAVGDAGVIALRGRDVERALLAAGGPMAGGALTAEDLAEAMPGEVEARVTDLDGAAALAAPFPWGAEARPAEVVVACDGRGAVAALAYAAAYEGIAVPDLEEALGRDAVPVRRGIPRVSPGTPLPAAAPIAILRAGGLSAAAGVPGVAPVDTAALAAFAGGASLAAALQAAVEAVTRAGSAPGAPLSGGATAVAVASDGRDARDASIPLRVEAATGAADAANAVQE